jgi:hypothetical protein
MYLRRVAATLAVSAVAALGFAATASAAPNWAPSSTATIHPGVQLDNKGAECTSNFVFYDSFHVYIGEAAHCTGQGGETETDGCTTGSLPIGTPIGIGGASFPGTLVYNSWIAMHQYGERSQNACQFNDFALIRINDADVGRVNPSIPFWGGPTGLNTTGTRLGDTVLTYGNSKLHLGIEALNPRQGISIGDSAGGWTHTVLTIIPGIPGDSGSAFMDRDGKALGVLSTLNILPLPATNGVGDVRHELEYMSTHGGPDVALAHGTAPFRGPLL